jgi:hypothetical protein
MTYNLETTYKHDSFLDQIVKAIYTALSTDILILLDLVPYYVTY